MMKLQRPRDKGRLNPGQLIKGSSQPRFTPASIPCKNKHTICYKTAEKAFGSALQRFSHSIEVKAGPGDYNLNSNPQNPSFSKKGFGPLISRMAKSQSRIPNRGPGPAEYTSTQSLMANKNKLKRAIKFGKSVSQGPFWHQNQHKLQNPGPFEYPHMTKTRASNLSHSSFRNGIKRWREIQQPQTPTATTYHPNESLVSRRSRVVAIQHSIPTTKRQIIESLFGKEKGKRGPGDYFKQDSKHSSTKTRQISGFKFMNQSIVNLNKIASVLPDQSFRRLMQASQSARSRIYSNREYNSRLSMEKC